MGNFELIQSRERFDEIADAWQDMWSKCPSSVFQSHSWISQFHRDLSSRHRLYIGALWGENGNLVAAVPCAVRRLWGVRILEWVAQEESDYCDALGDPLGIAACWKKMRTRNEFDIIRLKNIRADAAIVNLLQNDQLENTHVDECLLLRSAWPSGDAWVQAHFPKRRNKYSRGLRKLQELGQVEVEFHANPQAGVVDHLRHLKREWASSNGRSGRIIKDESLLKDLVGAIASLGCLLLVTIRCNGEVVAGSINVTHGRRLLSYFTVYNPKYHRASPGIILLAECTRWAFDNGYDEHDHLRGTEDYKLAFSNDSTLLCGYTGSRTALGGTVLKLSRLGRALRTSRFRQKMGDDRSVEAISTEDQTEDPSGSRRPVWTAETAGD